MLHIKPNPNAGIAGTCLQAKIQAPYALIEKLFGKPGNGDGYKVDAEWVLETPLGVATIYNYKDGKNYNGKDGMASTELTDWHIGGATPEPATFIYSVIEATLTI